MQPYFMPYIGYFQLLNKVDQFIIYDNIEYTKKGWINRNMILTNGKSKTITLPIKKDSDFLNIRDRYLADSWSKDKTKMLNLLKESYRKAPEFKNIFPLLEFCINYENRNLFEFIFHSIKAICEYLNLKTQILISSSISINDKLQSQEKVLAICQKVGADKYINNIGGINLYNKDIFSDKGVNLKFMKSIEINYQQYHRQFIPNLSIIDVLMFNSKKNIELFLNNYELI